MSFFFLYRTGTGRNNIVWDGNTSTVGNYLRRTGTGRNNIQFYIIPQSNDTYNILNRTGTGRNNITWQNTTFTFAFGLQLYPLTSHSNSTSSDFNVEYRRPSSTRYYGKYTINPNGYSLSGTAASASMTTSQYEIYVYSDQSSSIESYCLSNFSKVTLSWNTGESIYFIFSSQSNKYCYFDSRGTSIRYGYSNYTGFDATGNVTGTRAPQRIPDKITFS